jgi:hypothetical protein
VNRRGAAPQKEASPASAALGSPPQLPAAPSEPPVPTTILRARTPKAAGLPQTALAAYPCWRGLRPLDVFPGVRGVMHSAVGPQPLPGLASPTRELAGDPVQPASVVLSLRRRRPAPDRFPWRKAPTVRQCERPNELRDLPSPGLGPLASAPPLRPIPPDFSDWRSPAFPGRRRLPGARRAAPRTLGTPPIGLGPPAAALPPHRFAPAAEFDAPIAHDSASAARDSASTHGFKQGGGQDAGPAMPASHPHDLHRPASPHVGSCSGPSFIGAHLHTADPACAPAAGGSGGEGAISSASKGTTTNPSSLALPSLSVVAVSAHSGSQRAPLTSAGSSDARTQGGSRSSATRTDRGQSSAPIRRRQRCAVVSGVSTAVPVAASPRAGLIEKQSTGPAGLPAGTTQGVI